MDACSFTIAPYKGGFVLTCPMGRIGFSAEEHFFYCSLFDIYDFDEDGRMELKDSVDILKRSAIRDDVLKDIMLQVCGLSVDKSNKIFEYIIMEQFLLCCKLISNFQQRHNTDIKALVNETSDLPVASFGFNEKDLSIEIFDLSTTTTDHLEMEVIGWKTIGEGFSSHILYQIRYVTNIKTFSKNESLLHHRYSDFLFLSSQLERYRGTIIPEVPPKQWSVQIDETTAELRVRDLSIFLYYIAKHPRLRHSFELKVSFL